MALDTDSIFLVFSKGMSFRVSLTLAELMAALVQSTNIGSLPFLGEEERAGLLDSTSF